MSLVNAVLSCLLLPDHPASVPPIKSVQLQFPTPPIVIPLHNTPQALFCTTAHDLHSKISCERLQACTWLLSGMITR